MPEPKDFNQQAAQLVREVTGEAPEDMADAISDPETRRLYLEAKEKLKDLEEAEKKK